MQSTLVKLTTGEIARFLGAELEGDPSVEISRLASLEDGGKPGALSFLHDLRYTPDLYKTKSSAVIVAHDFKPEQNVAPTLLRVPNPYSAFNKVLSEFFHKIEKPKGIDGQSLLHESVRYGEHFYLGPFAQVHADCKIGKNVQIHGGSFIGKNVTLGDNVYIYPNVTIHHDCVIGSNVTIHSGVVIGGDGFGYLQEGGKNVKVPQVGNVVIEDEVEIQSNTTIDRATIGSTIIRKGVKIDNMVHIAHNCEIGEHSVIAAQVGIAGSCKIGRYCMLGGQVGIAPKVVLADFVQVSAQSGVSKAIKNKGKAFRGSPAREINQQLKLEAMQNRMPEMIKRIEELEKIVARFEDREI